MFNGLLIFFNNRLNMVNTAEFIGIWLQNGLKFLKDGRNVDD
jgi:hypothetical protein